MPSPAAPYRAFPLRFSATPSAPRPVPAGAGGPVAGAPERHKGGHVTPRAAAILSLGSWAGPGAAAAGRRALAALLPAMPHRVALPSRPPPPGARGSCGCGRGSAPGGGAGRNGRARGAERGPLLKRCRLCLLLTGGEARAAAELLQPEVSSALLV